MLKDDMSEKSGGSAQYVSEGESPTPSGRRVGVTSPEEVLDVIVVESLEEEDGSSVVDVKGVLV